MPRRSAGILLYRKRSQASCADGPAESAGVAARGPAPFRDDAIEVLLAHPGGPFWARKDDSAWSIPKGEYGPGEDPLSAARREFAEETGMQPEGEPIALGPFRQSSAKIVDAWAIEGDFDPATLRSNTFTLEWPPRSGKMREVPEVDRAAWFTPAEALHKLVKGQRPIVEALLRHLRGPGVAP